MNEQNEIITENVPVSEESMPETAENVSIDTENGLSSVESGEIDVPLENETVDGSVSLYDKLVEDIADKLKEDASVTEAGQGETDDTLEGSFVEKETSDTANDSPVLYVLPEGLEKDISSNDVGDILDYLKTREINTSLGMPFCDALLSDLSVTDGLLLIFLILFLFRWIYDFGRRLFS